MVKVIGKNSDIETLLTLIQKAKLGNNNALKELIEEFDPLIKKIAYKYCMNNNKALDDLIQEGRIGLLHAIRNFDPSKSLNFKMYAIFWIKQTILRGFEKFNNTIKIPVRKNQKIRKAKKIINNYMAEGKNLDDLPEIDEIEKVLKYNFTYISLENEYYNSKDNECIKDFIDDYMQKPEEIIEKDELLTKLNSLLNELNERDRMIISYRYGLNGNPRLTLKEIGKIYNLSSEAVRKIELKVINILKNKAKSLVD